MTMWRLRKVHGSSLIGCMRRANSFKVKPPGSTVKNQKVVLDSNASSGNINPWEYGTGLTKEHMNAVASLISEMKPVYDVEVHGDEESKLDSLLKVRDFDAMFELYKTDQSSLETSANKAKVITILLKMCQTAEDLLPLKLLLDDMRTYKVSTHELAYEAQLRCYLDMKDYMSLMEVMRSMIHDGYNPKSESLAAILEACVNIKNYRYVSEVLKVMNDVQAHIPPEKISSVFRIFEHWDESYVLSAKKQVSFLIYKVSQKVFGIADTDMVNMVSQKRQITPEKVLEEGVLVASLADIPGTIINESEVDKECREVQTVTVNEAKFFNVDPSIVAYQDHPVKVTSNRHLPIGAAPGQKIGTPSSAKEATHVTLDKSRTRNYTVLPSDLSALSASKAVKKAARIMVPSVDGCCPNCDYKIPTLGLSEIVRMRARLVLQDKEWRKSSEHKEYLSEFVDWLKAQPSEFSVVVDGYNVGFDSRHSKTGKGKSQTLPTSITEYLEGFERIKKTIAQIKTQDPNHNVLVIFPYLEKLPDTDDHIQFQKAIKSLSSECTVYMTPEGADAENYLFMSVLYEARQTKGLFLTNNNLRMSTDLFNPRSMMWWRFSGQITFEEGEELTLTWPGKYTRDFQFAPKPLHRWHIPSLSGSEWLCLKL